MKAVLRSIRLSPKKANLIAWMIRWMNAKSASDLLRFLDKKWADVIYKLLNSAMANAVNNDKKKKEDLIVSYICVTQWPTYKRWQSRSKWRVFKILKRTSHINISLWEIIKDELWDKDEKKAVEPIEQKEELVAKEEEKK